MDFNLFFPVTTLLSDLVTLVFYFQGIECCVHLEELSIENNCISKFEGKWTSLFVHCLINSTSLYDLISLGPLGPVNDQSEHVFVLDIKT